MSASDQVQPQPSKQSDPIQHLSIKIPAFMETAATGWFSIIEAQFHLSKITVEETKYYHVLASLPPTIVANLSPTILENKTYTVLKNAVIASFESTKPELFDKLISKTTMSGRPSVYLQELNATANKIGVGEDLIRHKFIQATPSTISPVLAAQKSLTLQQLGTLADELMPYFGSNNVLNIKSQNDRHQRTNYNEPSQQENPHLNRPTNQAHCPVGLRPYSESQRPKVCRAHLYFAEKARTCKPWCRWPDKKNCNMQPSSRPSSPARQSHSEN